MKILLAEDDGTLAGRLFHPLVKNGYQTTAVKTGQAALDYINAYQGDPDVNFQRILECVRRSGETITYDNLGHDVTLPCDQCQTVIREVIARMFVSILTLVTAVIVLAAAAIVFAIVATLTKHHARRQAAASAPVEPAEAAAAT